MKYLYLFDSLHTRLKKTFVPARYVLLDNVQYGLIKMQLDKVRDEKKL